MWEIFFLVKRMSETSGDGSSAQKSSAQKNCSTPKSRLLDTVQADAKNI
jgi:hypothetical protein